MDKNLPSTQVTRRAILAMAISCSALSLNTFNVNAQCNYTIGDLVWSDEFDYEGQPDPNKWGYDVGNSGWGNNEAQYYTDDRRENARVENGNLIIEARNESYGGSNYTSARMVTANKGDWLYGRIEVMAKVPLERGTWPAIWMLPTDWSYGGWPESGEIDIMEGMTAWGVHRDESHANIHTGSYNHMIGTNKGNTLTGLSDMQENYHLYAVDWYPDRMEFSVDDNYFFTFQNEGNVGAWPFDQRFHLILNVAIGGTLGGAIEDWHFPHYMIVDYVRVYGLEANDGNSTPYNGTATSLPGTLEAENFDEGCGTYSDTDTGNNGAGPRGGDVDMEETSDAGGGYNVGWLNAGEWLKYTVNASEAGTYNVTARVASEPGGGGFSLEANGTEQVSGVAVDATGGWQNWVSIDAGSVDLQAGENEIMFKVVDQGFNLNYLEFEHVGGVGIDEQQDQGFHLFPNPAQNKVQLQGLTQISDYQLTSLDGKTHASGKIAPAGSIDIENLAQGTYLVKVGSHVERLVK